MKNTMKKLLSLLLVAVMMVGIGILPSAIIPAQAATVSIPSDAVEFNGHYYKVYDESLSWSDAKAFCESLGGHLAVITSSEEQEVITEYTKANGVLLYYYIGGYKENGGWNWITGETFEYSCWSPGEPRLSGSVIQIYNNRLYEDRFFGAWDDTGSSNTGKDIGFICEWESGPVFPAGYDFDRDSYSFSNLNEPIPWNYYVSAFGAIRGYQLYNAHETGGNHGHCFGMAQSTASILKNAPVVSSFSNKSILDSLTPSDYSNELESTLRSYIKYSHIYQFTDSVASMRESNKGYDAVYNAVENYVKYGGVPILIDMWASFGGHTVYAVGIDGDDIIVNDSNEAEPEKRSTKIVKTENGWTYSGGGWNWNSDNGDTINYVTATTALYYMILDDLDNFISNHKLLVKGSQNLSYSSTSAMTEIRQSVLNENSEINNQRLYWLDDVINTITITNNTLNDETVCVSGYDLAIEAILPNDASALVQIGEDVENGISIYSTNGENVDFTFTTEQFDSELLFMSIAGTASGDAITATQTETGLLVTGISDGTVTLSKDDEVIATQTISDAISDIEITYDKTGADESIEVDYEQPEEPTDPEVPTEPETPTDPEPDEPTGDTPDCSCLCHSKNSFMQFIYKIIRFFWQLFGMNMDCACGAKHFDSYFFG